MSPQRVLMAVVVAVPVIAAVLAAFGFKGRHVVAGLDLGTTYSTLAYRINDERFVLRDAHNRTTTPSIIAVRQGRFAVGEDALDALTDDPMSVVFDAKRVIGRTWGDDVLISENARHQGRIVPHPVTRRDSFGRLLTWWKTMNCRDCVPEPAFVVRVRTSDAVPATTVRKQLEGHRCVDRGSIMSRSELRAWLIAQRNSTQALDAVPGSDGDTFLLLTPTAAACIVVRHMFDALLATVKHATVKSSVVTVPAEFTVAQRTATTDAYVRAGITPNRVLHEPAAAAVAYGLHRDPRVHNVMVFDMGGGTLDISVLFVQKGAFSLIGSAGDVHLGGEDFDDCMLRVILSQLQEREGMHIAQDGTEEDGRDAAAAATARGPALPGSAKSAARRRTSQLDATAHGVCSLAWLKHEAERVKIALSSPAHVAAPSKPVTWQCRVEASADGGPARSVRHTITRAQFEETCDSLFQRALEPVREGLEAANLRVDEVQEVVLVGGSSRLPRVRELLSQLFRHEVRQTVDPDLAVATGASLIID